MSTAFALGVSALLVLGVVIAVAGSRGRSRSRRSSDGGPIIADGHTSGKKNNADDSSDGGADGGGGD